MSINRRTLFGAAAVVTSYIGAALTGRKANAKTIPADLEPRGSIDRLERLATLDGESRNDFLTGMRGWRMDTVVPVAQDRFNDILKANDYDPKKDLPRETIFNLINNDHLVGGEARIRIDTQRLAQDNNKWNFESNADAFLEEMEAYDKIGPGTLELNPGMHIPDYTKHEIHMQPGGYVGSPFAGAIYHHGTNAFYLARNSRNYQDEHHTKLGNQVGTPSDSRITRVLDMGCGIGQLTIALKERFPNAEVWGVDVAGPMVRYGHMRAVDLNVDVNLAQRLAEDTKFPDSHFDIVTSNILHHEVTADASKKIIAEAYRIVRPGGVFFPMDFFTGNRRPPNTAYGSYMQWKDHRWNNEVWRMEYANLDFPGEMRTAGFEVNEKGPRASFHRHNVIGVKPA